MNFRKIYLWLLLPLVLLDGGRLWSDVIIKSDEVDFLSFEINRSTIQYKYGFEFSFEKSNSLAVHYEKKPNEKFVLEYNEFLQVRNIRKFSERGEQLLEIKLDSLGLVESILETLPRRGYIYLEFNHTGFITQKKLSLGNQVYQYDYNYVINEEKFEVTIDYFVNQKFHSRKRSDFLGKENYFMNFEVTYFDYQLKPYKTQKISRLINDKDNLVTEKIENYISSDKLTEKNFSIFENGNLVEKYWIKSNASLKKELAEYHDFFTYQNGMLSEWVRTDETGQLVQRTEYYYQQIEPNIGITFIDLFKHNWLEKTSYQIDNQEIQTKYLLHNYDQELVSVIKEEKRGGELYRESLIIIDEVIEINFYKNDRIYYTELKNFKGEPLSEVEYIYSREDNLIETRTRHFDRLDYREKYFYVAVPNNTNDSGNEAELVSHLNQVSKISEISDLSELNNFNEFAELNALSNENAWMKISTNLTEGLTYTNMKTLQDRSRELEWGGNAVHYYLGKMIFRYYQKKKLDEKSVGLIEKEFPTTTSIQQQFKEFVPKKNISDLDYADFLSIDEYKLFTFLENNRLAGLIKVIRYDHEDNMDVYLRISYSTNLIEYSKNYENNNEIKELVFKYYSTPPKFSLILDHPPSYIKDSPYVEVSDEYEKNFKDENKGSVYSFNHLANDHIKPNLETIDEKITLQYRMQIDEDGNRKYEMVKVKREVYDEDTGKVIIDEVL